MTTPKVLLVDDTKLFLRLEQEYLRQSSVVVLTAGNGREALEIIRKDRPDLVYMDLNMPEMDGISCCRAVKADPDLHSTPIILVTTEGLDDSVARCREAGCDGFLTKPIDRRKFLEFGRTFLADINRREKRVPCRLRVLFRINSQENLFGECVDLSRRGMYVAFAGGIRLEDKVEVSMLVSGNSDDLVEAWGRVSWINQAGARIKYKLPEGFGIEFLSITEDSLQLINKFIDQGISP